MPSRIRYGLVVLWLGLLNGCADHPLNVSGEDPFENLPKDSVVVPMTPIDSKLIYSLREYLAPSRYVEMVFRTETIYGWSGIAIVTSHLRLGKYIYIRLDSLRQPEMGNAIFSPAMAILNLGVLPDDVYTVEIVVNGKSLEACILVTDTSLTTRVQPNNIVHPSLDQTLRVPPNIIWGQSESIPPGIHQIFLDSLVILGAAPHALSPGNYFYFTVNTDGTFSNTSMFGMPYGQRFLYRWDPDPAISRALVKRFAHRYQDSIYIQLTGGRGEEYYSTVLRWEP